jgi:hypothetical protein
MQQLQKIKLLKHQNRPHHKPLPSKKGTKAKDQGVTERRWCKCDSCNNEPKKSQNGHSATKNEPPEINGVSKKSSLQVLSN